MINVNVNKIQALKDGEYGDPKYTFTHTRKREITQCDTEACSCSNNAETNSFFAPNASEPNKVLRLISLEKKFP